MGDTATLTFFTGESEVTVDIEHAAVRSLRVRRAVVTAVDDEPFERWLHVASEVSLAHRSLDTPLEPWLLISTHPGRSQAQCVFVRPGSRAGVTVTRRITTDHRGWVQIRDAIHNASAAPKQFQYGVDLMSHDATVAFSECQQPSCWPPDQLDALATGFAADGGGGQIGGSCFRWVVERTALARRPSDRAASAASSSQCVDVPAGQVVETAVSLHPEPPPS